MDNPQIHTTKMFLAAHNGMDLFASVNRQQVKDWIYEHCSANDLDLLDYEIEEAYIVTRKELRCHSMFVQESFMYDKF